MFQPAGVLVKVAETVILDPTNKGKGMFPRKKKHKTQRHSILREVIVIIIEAKLFFSIQRVSKSQLSTVQFLNRIWLQTHRWGQRSLWQVRRDTHVTQNAVQWTLHWCYCPWKSPLYCSGRLFGCSPWFEQKKHLIFHVFLLSNTYFKPAYIYF